VIDSKAGWESLEAGAEAARKVKVTSDACQTTFAFVQLGALGMFVGWVVPSENSDSRVSMV
jgi:hypothetical protein